MKNLMIKMMIKMLISTLSTEMLTDLYKKLGDLAKLGTDEGLDLLEDYIEGTKTKLDDELLPVIATIRLVINVPDDD